MSESSSHVGPSPCTINHPGGWEKCQLSKAGTRTKQVNRYEWYDAIKRLAPHPLYGQPLHFHRVAVESFITLMQHTHLSKSCDARLNTLKVVIVLFSLLLFCSAEINQQRFRWLSSDLGWLQFYKNVSSKAVQRKVFKKINPYFQAKFDAL